MLPSVGGIAISSDVFFSGSEKHRITSGPVPIRLKSESQTTRALCSRVQVAISYMRVAKCKAISRIGGLNKL